MEGFSAGLASSDVDPLRPQRHRATFFSVSLLSLHPIRGREQESTYLASLGADLNAVPGLVLTGEPGIGKSAMLREAQLSPGWDGVHVVAAIVVPDHLARPLSVLTDVLRLLGEPHPARTESLGELMADAFTVASRKRPTILVLDDAQCIDDMSWEALTHAARLVPGERFALVASLPDGHPRERQAGLPSLMLGPLSSQASTAVLDDMETGLPTFVRDRILEASGGNPLAIRELAAATAEQWQTRCVRPPSALPLTPRLIGAFVAPVERLPALTQEVLLAAAANDAELLSEAVSVAAMTMRVSPEEALTACLPAFELRLVDSSSTTLRFRTEVARSAVYQAASLPRRHALHTAFAHLLASAPDRAAWHRAAASLKPDETLAAQLETAGNATRARGQIRNALATMDRAVRVSQEPSARVERLIDAAEMSFEIGRPDFVSQFAAQAAAQAETSAQRLRLRWTQSIYDLWRPDHGNGIVELMEHAERAAAEGKDAQVRTVVTRMAEKVHVTPIEQVPTAEILAFTERLGGPDAHPALLNVLATAMPIEQGADVLRRVAGHASDAGGDPRLARVFGEAAMMLGDDRKAVSFFTTSIDRLRAEGRFGFLPFALLDRARALIGGASLDLARRDIAEGTRLAVETAQPILVGRLRAIEAVVAGLMGDADAARLAANEAEQLALDRPALLVDVHVARGFTALAAADYEAAFEALDRLWDEGVPMLAVSRRWMVVGEYAEAAALCGRVDRVRAHVEELSVAATAVPSPVLRAGVDYAVAVLGAERDADAAFIRARESAASRGPLVAGRAHLTYGNWLRRQRKITQARTELRAALTTFEGYGARAWSDRARQELRASGATSADALAPVEVADLTPQERQIAELAASGLSNRDIGQRLFLSHRTISTHLYRIYPKLGVTSRAQLRDALTYATRVEGSKIA
jgi:DNA-binding CsgD family transcriptional regulator